MRTLIALLLVSFALYAGTASACTAEGAFGIAFGSKPKRVGKKIRGNDATISYEVKPPQPDPRFDQYELRIDALTREVLEVVAIRTITPQPEGSSPIAPEE